MRRKVDLEELISAFADLGIAIKRNEAVNLLKSISPTRGSVPSMLSIPSVHGYAQPLGEKRPGPGIARDANYTWFK
ncbi:hypothetical protein MSG28_001178 [Choristoneura fumiferana]|uniref:Uncharacterized protein n=1 Tax=Choristoneura fumiferana TaxID=7141 RepID=A0ACC0K408_CHOFU|nr:hypothetical protein MSG28_001178 [Choristoneura fumiferana]